MLEEDRMYTSTETDNVNDPQFKDPVIQRTLAHRKLIEHQADDVKITHIMKQIMGRQIGEKRIFTNRTEGSMKGRVEFYMVDGVLYANKEDQGPGKPVLPQNMVNNEIFRAHTATHHRGMQVALEHIRKYYHHSSATSEVTLENLAAKLLPCLKCMWRQKMSLTRGVLPYAESRSILMTMGGLPCAIWSHDIIHLSNEDIMEIPKKYLSLMACNGCGFAHTKLS